VGDRAWPVLIRIQAAVPAAEHLTGRDRARDRRVDHPDPQGTHRSGPGRRGGHDRLASGTPPPGTGVTGHHQPLPDAAWPHHPGTEETTAFACIRFQAELPNETWQADFTHYRLADGTDTEILTWLDDHSRYAPRCIILPNGSLRIRRTELDRWLDAREDVA
jgi:hypothetical protein